MSPNYSNDLFISYSHLDNRPWGLGSRTWVTGFHRELATRLTMLLGRQVRIWRDERFSENELNDEIATELRNSRALLCIMSPHYFESQRCLRELWLFRQKGIQPVAAGTNLFKVIKTPVERAEQPSELQDSRGYEFFHASAAGEIREFYPGPPRDTDEAKSFWRKIDQLAQDIDKVLQSFGDAEVETAGPWGPTSPSKPEASAPSDRRRTVFLSYRREDTQDAAGRLHDRLVEAYSANRVFMDIDSVPLGIDFVDHVTE